MLKTIRYILELAFWIIAGAGAIIALGVIFAMVLTPALGYLGAIAAIGLLPAGLLVSRAIRRRRAGAVLGYLEQAVRLNLPLPRLLEAATRSEHGRTASRLQELERGLASGLTVSAALNEALPEVSRRDLSRIAASERIGQLGRALGRIARQRRFDAQKGGEADAIFIRGYPLAMAIAICGITAMLMIFVMPKFEQIYHDFGLQLPPVTRDLLDFSYTAGQPVAIAVGVIVLLFCGLKGREMIHASRPGDSLLRGLWDRLRWITPLLHGLERDRAMGDSCEVIADALDAGMPADAAIGEAAALEMNRVARHRVERWSTEVAGGGSLSESARRAGLPAIIAGMLAPVRGAEAPEVFRFLARYYHARFHRTGALLYGAAIPLMVFAFAAWVAFVALALFLPLIHMVDFLSSHAMRF